MRVMEGSHHEPTGLIFPLTLLENIDCLNGHLLQTWLVNCVCPVASRRIFQVTKVLGEHLMLGHLNKIRLYTGKVRTHLAINPFSPEAKQSKFNADVLDDQHFTY
jgi:hypothetical protein